MEASKALPQSDRTCLVQKLGLLPYEQAWKLQETIASQIVSGERPATLLLLEHPHTFTFGRRGEKKNLLWDDAELTRRGVSVFWVDRGGDVTYHGPGQLVGYPLIKLKSPSLFPSTEGDIPSVPKADYVGYLRQLERVLVATLASFGIQARQVAGLTGVWVDSSSGGSPNKIAAIGVKVDAHGVTRHGFALNVAPDMSYWGGIIGCGLANCAQISMAEVLPQPPAMDEVIQALITAFGNEFGMDMLLSV